MPDLAPAQALFTIKNRIALVAGTSSELGLRDVQTLAHAGAKVVGAARRPEFVNVQALSLPNSGHDVHGLRMGAVLPVSGGKDLRGM